MILRVSRRLAGIWRGGLYAGVSIAVRSRPRAEPVWLDESEDKSVVAKYFVSRSSSLLKRLNLCERDPP